MKLGTHDCENGSAGSALISIQIVRLMCLGLLWKGILCNFQGIRFGQCPEGIRIEMEYLGEAGI